MLTRLGHEPILVTMPAPEQLLNAEVLVVEPASPVGVVLAQAARLVNPSLTLICVSVAAPPGELAELGVVFAASLVKPFTADQLGVAINRSLRAGHRHGSQPTRYRADDAA
jgi:hypothetical protein